MQVGPFELQWQTHTGEPWTVDERTLTPESQALVVRFPYGGFVWNRPSAVLVNENGATRRLPIVDVTRLALMVMGGVTFGTSLGVFVARLAAQVQRENEQTNGGSNE